MTEIIWCFEVLDRVKSIRIIILLGEEEFKAFWMDCDVVNAPTTEPTLTSTIILFGVRLKSINLLKCPCHQKINCYFSLDFKTMLTKH